MLSVVPLCKPAAFKVFYVLSATVHGGEDLRGPQAGQEGLRSGLWWEFSRVPVLPLPPHSGLWGLWLGLDYCPKALQGQLLLWRVWVHVLAEVPTHPPGEQGQPQGECRSLLYPHQDVTHQHALLQPQGADHLRKDPVHGGRPLRLLLIVEAQFKENDANSDNEEGQSNNICGLRAVDC